MSAEAAIYKTVLRIVERYGTRDPFALAKALGVTVLVRPLGGLKGFYKVVFDRSFLFLNDALDENAARTVCAHELGHHILHRSAAAYGFEEVSVFPKTSRREYEANLFAAELLIPDGALAEPLERGYAAPQIAALLGAGEALTALKLAAFTERKRRPPP